MSPDGSRQASEGGSGRMGSEAGLRAPAGVRPGVRSRLRARAQRVRGGGVRPLNARCPAYRPVRPDAPREARGSALLTASVGRARQATEEQRPRPSSRPAHHPADSQAHVTHREEDSGVRPAPGVPRPCPHRGPGVEVEPDSVLLLPGGQAVDAEPGAQHPGQGHRQAQDTGGAPENQEGRRGPSCPSHEGPGHG